MSRADRIMNRKAGNVGGSGRNTKGDIGGVGGVNLRGIFSLTKWFRGLFPDNQLNSRKEKENDKANPK